MSDIHSAPIPERPSHAPSRTRREGRARGRIIVIAGTRPECIKLAPLVRALAHRDVFETVLVNSGQHRDPVTHMFRDFGIDCDITAPQLAASPNLRVASERLRAELRAIIDRARPSMVAVQGDTLTAYSGARAAHDQGCPVIHVEAGLRSPSIADPFPEEWFRRRIARHATWHFAPSDTAHANLLAEGIDPLNIHRVGNTGIDSLRRVLQHNPHWLAATPTPRQRILVTLHRRENWDSKADVICDALHAIARARPELRMLVPLHPNPRIAPRIRKRLRDHASFNLVEPMNYSDFIATAATAALIISDSGGIQEEAPHLGVPLLVPRNCTERPEGVATGFVRLVAIDEASIVRAALAMLDTPVRTGLPFDDDAPFGAGDAAMRIVNVLERSVAATMVA